MRNVGFWASLLLRGIWASLGAAAAIAAAQTDGARQWPFTTMSSSTVGSILSSPAVASDGTIYFGTEIGNSTTATSGGQLFALRPDGSKKWVFTASDWIDSTPGIGADGTVYFGCWNGNFYALNPDGSQKWVFAAGTYISASPALGADGTIYFGDGKGNFYALNPDGTKKWIFPTLYWIDSAPAVAPDGTIYVGSLDNNVYAINPDGSEKWHYTTGNDVTGSPAIGADGTVYIGSRDSLFYAFTPAGAVKWTFASTDTFDASPVLGADGTVYVPSTGGRVFALAPDGTERWRFPAAGQTALNSIYSTPAVREDGSLVFGTSNNALYAVSAAGALLWQSPLGDWADSSAVVTGSGHIYIGCFDKILYSFSSAAGPSMTDWPQLLRDDQRTGRQPLGAASGTTGRLINLSVRTNAGSGSDTLTVGFVVAGTGNRTMLVRGIGPTLANFGVTGVLPDPNITLFHSAGALAANDNWGQAPNAPQIISLSNSLGAFALPTGSLDAALLANLSAGPYSVQLMGTPGTSGIALVEAYDGGGDAGARLANLSALSQVRAGLGALVAGFVVAGSPRAVLVRGVGPTLANFDVAGVLANASVQVFDGAGRLVAENNGWGTASNSAAIASTSQAVGAFPLPSGSQDAVMLLTLPPGNYSAQVSGLGNATGAGLVEVYEVP